MNFPASFPTPTLATSGRALRWGILGPGGIAGAFVDAVRSGTPHIVQAVASRSPERAAGFAAAHGIAAVHGTYDALVSDKNVDAIYVATVPTSHRDLALLAIAAGKPVLVEKPFAPSAADAAQIVAAARAAGVFAMEAMWTRYLPQSAIIRQLRDDGVFGDIRLLTADHSQRITPDGRLWRPGPGSGALLDLGVYPLAFAFDVLHEPEVLSAEGSLTPDGVVADVLMSLRWASGARAQLSTSIRSRTPVRASISGTGALLELDSPFFAPTRMTLSRPGWLAEGIVWEGSVRPVHLGMSHQLLAFASYLDEGRGESPLQPLGESVAILASIEAARSHLTAGPEARLSMQSLSPCVRGEYR